MATIYGLANTLDIPARQAFVAEMVGKESLVSAIALNSAVFNGARVVGPAAAGLVIASWGIDTILAGMPAEVEKYITGWKDIRLDLRAVSFTFAAAILTGLLAGLVPAWQSSRARINDALKEGSRGSAGRGRHRLRAVLVAAQIRWRVVESLRLTTAGDPPSEMRTARS